MTNATKAATTIRMFSLATALALSVGTALAQNGVLEGGLDRPLVTTGSTATMHIIETNNGDEWTLEVSGDQTKATHNGEAIPADRIRQSKGKVEILDKSGAVVKTFHVAPQGSTMVFGTQPDGRRRQRMVTTPRGGERTLDQAQVIEMAPPKVMVGVRMSEKDGDVVVDDVIEGLPAEAAGVKTGDTLVSVDGTAIHKTTDLRDGLKDKNPGDKINLVVRRDGKEQTLAIELREYKADKMGAAAVTTEPGADQWWTKGDEDRWVEAAKKHVEEAIEQIRKSDALNSEKAKDAVEKAMRQALAALNEAGKGANSMWREFAMKPGQDGVVLFGPDHQNLPQRFFIPGGGEDSSTKLDRLNEQLDRMNERLDALQKRLEKLDKPK